MIFATSQGIFFLVGTFKNPQGNNSVKSNLLSGYFLPSPLKSWGIPWTYFSHVWKLCDWEVYGSCSPAFFLFHSYTLPFSQWAFYSFTRNKIKVKTEAKPTKHINVKGWGETGNFTQKTKIIPKNSRVKWGLIILPQGKIKIRVPRTGHLVQTQLTT